MTNNCITIPMKEDIKKS